MKNNKKLLSKFLTVILSTMMIFSSVFAYGVLAETEYNAEFLNEEKEVIASGSFTDVDELLSLIPEEPTKEHYNFDGWYYGEQLLNEEIDISALEEGKTISLTPSYSHITHTLNIYYYTNNKFRNSEFRILNENEETEIEAPVLKGRVFEKWASDENGENVLSEEEKYNITLLEDTNLYAFYSVDEGLMTSPLTSSPTQTIKKHTVTFMKEAFLGFTSYKSIEVPDGKSINEAGYTMNDIGYPNAPRGVNAEDKSLIWYKKIGLTGLLGTQEFSFNTAVTENIKLYPKYILKSSYESIFDFRVEGTNGSYTKDGYSYYMYYNEDHGLYDLIENFFLAPLDFSGFEVAKYNFVMSEDQVIYQIIEDSRINNVMNNGVILEHADIDGDGELTEFDKKYVGEKCVKEESLSGSKGLYRIGSYYEGTAFDIAIQEAVKGSKIEILHDMYITKPIEIWSDLDLDLRGNTIVYDENSLYLEHLHCLDRLRKSDVVISKDINAAIVVSNSLSTISNGEIFNFHKSGKGVLSFNVINDDAYVTTLKNLKIYTNKGNNTNQNAVEAGYNMIDNAGNLADQAPGYVVVESGEYHGYFKNNNEGSLKLLSGVKSEYDPRKLKSGAETGITVQNGYQVWDDNNQNSLKFIIGEAANFEIINSYNESVGEYRTLLEAISAFNKTTNKAIRLVSNMDLSKLSYATNGVLNLNVAKDYTIDLNNKTISGNEIDITRGNVTITNPGFVKTRLLVTENSTGTLTIENGKYNFVYNARLDNNKAIVIKGGSYADNVNDYVAEGYSCVYHNVPAYPWSIINNNVNEAITIKVENSEDQTFNTITSALNYIAGLSKDAIITLELNTDFETNEVIKITRPLNIVLNNHTLTSTVDFNTANSVGFSTIYVDIANDYSNKDVVISNGNIINKSIAGDADSLTGIYVNNGNVTLNGVTMQFDNNSCDNVYAIYNKNGNNFNITNMSRIVMENVDVYGNETFVYNGGNMYMNFGFITLTIGESCPNAKGIVNDGNLELDNYSSINVSGQNGESPIVYGVYSKGDVHLYNSASLSITNNKGNAYGIYQNNPDSSKTIILDKGSKITINRNANNKSSIAAGVYVDTVSTEKITNVLLGESTITVNSYNKAYGIYTAGGYVYAGTYSDENVNPQVEQEVLRGEMFDRAISAKDLEYIHDEIYNKDNIYDTTWNYKKFARININAGNNSVGVCCDYGPRIEGKSSQRISQLVNAVITMNISEGSASYCAKANSTVVGIEVISGYYYSNINNSMMSGNVYIRNGFFNRDITTKTLKNYICYKLDTPVNFDSRNYDYTIKGSGCSMTISVNPEDALKVKISITYDSSMTKDKQSYGVRIVFGDENNPIIVDNKTITESEEPGATYAVPKYSYIYYIPIKTMVDNLSVSIVRFEKGTHDVEHTYHTVSKYSVEQYYYEILADNVNYSSNFRDLAATSLRLGAAAQKSFDYKENDLATEGLVDKIYTDGNSQRYTADVPANNDINNLGIDLNNTRSGDLVDRFTNYKHSLELESYATLRTYFTLASTSDSIDHYQFGYTQNGGPYHKLEVHTSSDGKYYLDIDKISIVNIVDEFVLIIKDKNDGKTCNIEFNPLDFIYAVVVNPDGATIDDYQELCNLMKAYYQCYLAALKFYY